MNLNNLVEMFGVKYTGMVRREPHASYAIRLHYAVCFVSETILFSMEPCRIIIIFSYWCFIFSILSNYIQFILKAIFFQFYHTPVRSGNIVMLFVNKRKIQEKTSEVSSKSYHKRSDQALCHLINVLGYSHKPIFGNENKTRKIFFK